MRQVDLRGQTGQTLETRHLKLGSMEEPHRNIDLLDWLDEYIFVRAPSLS